MTNHPNRKRGIDANDSTESYRRATFKAATKGMRAYTIALKLIGFWIDFRGSTKQAIENAFAESGGLLRHVDGRQLRDLLQRHAFTVRSARL